MTLKNVSARRKKPSRGRRAPRTSSSASASGGASSRVWAPKLSEPPSGEKPAATAIPSTSVDFPLPFSPTRNVTPGASGRSSSAASAGIVHGQPEPRSRTRTKRISGSGEEVRADRGKAVEVVDVVLELGDDQRRRVTQLRAQPRHVG